jgi:hypothetical protein
MDKHESFPEKGLLELEESLYFGSKDHTVFLTPVSSQVFRYEPNLLQKTADYSSVQTTLSFRNAVSYLGADYKTHFVPCVPAADIHQSISLSSLPHSTKEGKKNA